MEQEFSRYRHMNRVAVLNLVGLTRPVLRKTERLSAWSNTRQILTVKPVFPALTSPAQATYLTGLLPSRHGIVANGWMNRELGEVHFWKQSNRLVHGMKLWEDIRNERPGFTCANLFWWFNMHSSADWSITPRPIYRADGLKVLDIDSSPRLIRETIQQELGDFPFTAFWGPAAGIESSAWIARAAVWMEEKYRPDLHLIYLPHLDYGMQRFGPHAPEVQAEINQIDNIAGDLIHALEERGIHVVLLSEYGITEVHHPIFLNREFRHRGWLSIRDELGREMLDSGGCKALAVADHQVAHIYINDVSITNEVIEAVATHPGVERVVAGSSRADLHIQHPRSGDLVAIAKPDYWFSYYFWEDDRRAPDFSRTVDIHRKPGYDPAELFLDPELRFPRLRIATRLLQRRLGMRYLFDVIPLNASLVRGSHGRVPEDEDSWPLVVTRADSEPGPIDATGVYGLLRSLCIRGTDQLPGSPQNIRMGAPRRICNT